jgi:hypothetical protein
MSKEAKPAKGRVPLTILPEIQLLIEMSRHHAAVTANLALVNLYWNIGRIITQDIQKNEKRAGYGEQLLESLAKALSREYGKGYSRADLQDMRRFFGSKYARRCLTNSPQIQFARHCLANPLMGKFSRHRLGNPQSQQFCRHCLQNLQPVFRLTSTNISVLDGPITDSFSARKIHLSGNSTSNKLGH